MRLWFLTYLHHAQLVEADQDGLRFKGKECRSHPPVGGRRVHSMVELESWEETCTDAAPGTPSAFPDELSTGLGAVGSVHGQPQGWLAPTEGSVGPVLNTQQL